jgi:hypothetical protein
MQKYVFAVLYNLIQEIKDFKKYDNLEKIAAILNSELPSIECKSVTVNDSTTASNFYGIIVYPDFDIDSNQPMVRRYTIEIQRQTIDLLSAKELAALIIHDISHNVLSSTVFERIKLAIIKACRMTSMKVIDIGYNMDKRISDIACLDVSNRTFKSKVISGLDMYEPDRLLVDMEIEDWFNSAVDKMATVESVNLGLPDDQEIADTQLGLLIVKMVRERLRNINATYDQLAAYIKAQYDSKVIEVFTRTYIERINYRDGLRPLLADEELKPYDLSVLQEGVTIGIKRHSESSFAVSLNEATTTSVFGSGKISYSELQRELDILNFKIESIGSNYERLAILDRIYDNIFSLENYLKKNPNDKIIWDYLEKFINITANLKDAKVSKRKYGVFVETPPGYEG